MTVRREDERGILHRSLPAQTSGERGSPIPSTPPPLSALSQAARQTCLSRRSAVIPLKTIDERSSFKVVLRRPSWPAWRRAWPAGRPSRPAGRPSRPAIRPLWPPADDSSTERRRQLVQKKKSTSLRPSNRVRSSKNLLRATALSQIRRIGCAQSGYLRDDIARKVLFSLFQLQRRTTESHATPPALVSDLRLT